MDRRFADAEMPRRGADGGVGLDDVHSQLTGSLLNVLPHVPDAQWFFEENISAKKPVIKTGAEIPFTRYFYKYQQPKPSEKLEKQFLELEKSVSERITKLFG